MNTNRSISTGIPSVLIFAFLAAVIVFGSPANAMGTAQLPATGPDSTTCYSADFHAASDCDRLVSEQGSPAAIPSTGSVATAPTQANCYSAGFHAASDCDRLASGFTLGEANTTE